MTDYPTISTPQDPAAEQPAAPEPEVAAPAAEPIPAPGPSSAEAWQDVVVKLRELGDAFAVWTKSATDTPENRRHVEEVRSGVNEMARQASDAFSSVAASDFGRQVSEGAQEFGQAAQEFGAAAAPHVASAFSGLADMFGRAAHKVEESVSQASQAAPPAPAPARAPTAAPAAPAPAPAEPTAPVAPQPPADAAE
jgi:2-oxoglutarate dehydrogenase E2 component (dihydrolipoamide succinyltransferase)